MKHLRRSIKYFIQICILFVVIIGALMLLGYVSPDVNSAFRGGWKSIGLIAVFFIVMSSIYPLFGYGKRTVRAKGEPSEHFSQIDKAFEDRGYVLESRTDNEIKYHLKSPIARATRLWEDTVTVTPILGAFEVEGLMRDLARVVMSMDRNINSYE